MSDTEDDAIESCRWEQFRTEIDALWKRRKALKVTQRDLAARAGIHRTTLLNVELHRTSNPHTLQAITEALDDIAAEHGVAVERPVKEPPCPMMLVRRRKARPLGDLARLVSATLSANAERTRWIF